MAPGEHHPRALWFGNRLPAQYSRRCLRRVRLDVRQSTRVRTKVELDNEQSMISSHAQLAIQRSLPEFHERASLQHRQISSIEDRHHENRFGAAAAHKVPRAIVDGQGLNPIRVKHLVLKLDTGGMENGVINLCSRLPQERFATSICTLIPDGKLEARARSRGVPIIHVPRRYGNDPRVPFQLARILRRDRIDVLHSHNWGTLLEAYGAQLLNRRTRLIHGEHGRLMTEYRRVFAQRLIWPRCARVLSVSGDLARRMSEEIGYPRDRITVIPNGVDISRFTPMPDQPKCVSEGNLVLRLIALRLAWSTGLSNSRITPEPFAR